MLREVPLKAEPFLVACFLLLATAAVACAGAPAPTTTKPRSTPAAIAQPDRQSNAPPATATRTPTVFFVGNTGGIGAYIRRTPRLNDNIKAWPDDTELVQVGRDRRGEGRVWKNVRDPDGNVGFIPAEYLVVQQVRRMAPRSTGPADTDTMPLVQVIKVVDGDTVDVLLRDETIRLRLIGIDTPETVDPRKPVECFGKEASARAKELLDNKTVRLETDASQGDLDQYGRQLTYVWLPDGQLFNLVMIAEGFAHEYTFNLPYKYQSEFKQAQRDARDENRGLWSPATCSGNAERPAPSTESITLCVGNTGGEGVYIRRTPRMPDQIKAWPDGTRMRVVGSNTYSDSRQWKNVADPDGNVGFVPVEYLSDCATAPVPPPDIRGNCDPAYPGVCIPPPPPDLDCGEISHRRFRVLRPDPHRFDGDRDGIGCER